MTFGSIGLALCGFSFLVVSALPASAASPIIVTCSPKTLKIVASEALTKSTSTSYADIKQGAVNFRQGGTSPSCVLVRFSAEASSKQDGITIRPLLDAATTSAPKEAAFGGMECIPTVGCTTRSYSFEFVFPSVAPGNHSLRMQLKTAFGDAFGSFITSHTTVVQYAP